MKENSNHISVLRTSIRNNLDVKPDGVYVDLTLGGGGHSLDILKRLKKGKLVAVDLDKRALERFKSQLEAEYSSKLKVMETGEDKQIRIMVDQNEVVLINDNFTNLEYHLASLNIANVDGIIADLGWSSDQLTEIEGLSFENDEHQLDMRFDNESQVKANDLLNGLGKRELMMLFKKYADFSENEARSLAKSILKERESEQIQRVGQLNNIVERTFKNIRGRSGENINQTKSRVYQSLRIAVNNEYANLISLIKEGNTSLSKDARLLLITFHSGEHRIAKEQFKNLISEGELKFISKQNGKNYIYPDLEELKENIRSRSAKLWVVQKLK